MIENYELLRHDRTESVVLLMEELVINLHILSILEAELPSLVAEEGLLLLLCESLDTMLELPFNRLLVIVLVWRWLHCPNLGKDLLLSC